MSANPFKIYDLVQGSYEVERFQTTIISDINFEPKWREEFENVLTLDEILKQYTKQYNEQSDVKNDIPLLKVLYERGLWGVIFEVGNCPELGKKWIVHGVTKGFA